MKIHNCDQRSDEWRTARLGLWTASFFDKCVTSTMKASTSANTINNKLVAEIITGKVEETFTNAAMERGKELEQEAMEFLNFTHGYNFREVGFCDSEMGYGCSPDGLSDEIGLEMKCPLAHTHVQYLSDNKLPTKYVPQVQGQMLVTGYKKWVFFSYHPDFPPLHVIVNRDEQFCAKLKQELLKNVAIIRKRSDRIKRMMQ